MKRVVKYLILSFGIWNLIDLFFNWLEYAEKFRYLFIRLPVALFLLYNINNFSFTNKILTIIFRILLVIIIFALIIPPEFYYNVLILKGQ